MGLLVAPVVAYPATPESSTPPVEAPAVSTPSSSSTADSVETRQAALKQRVMDRWDALIRKDFAAAYAFASPGYRKLFSLGAFKGKFGSKASWRRVEVVKVDFKGDDAATVGITLHFAHYPPQADKALDMKTYVNESWVFVDGQWWYLVQD
jgi:hypothetical protein